MATQINAVENPIINSPYDEPKQHWLIQEGLSPQKQSGRRPASYFLHGTFSTSWSIPSDPSTQTRF